MSLSYTTTPFHPTISYTGQVQAELGLANNNFTTLAQAFINNDPTSLTVVYSANSASIGGYGVSSTPAPNVLLPLNSSAQFPINVFPPINNNSYANPINLSSATSDYSLTVGQVAYISFSNATSVPLHIATTNGTYYELNLACSTTSGTYSGVYLNPNNTTYSSAFTFIEYWNSVSGGSFYTTTFSAFRIGWGVAVSIAFISNFTTLKNARVLELDTGFSPNGAANTAIQWNDTTTSWTSLGTVTFPQATTGYVLVRRLA